MDSVTRFSDRATDYVRYRPTYPAEAIAAILDGLGPPGQLVAADIGAGTGISARLLGDAGVRVIAVEPGEEMRMLFDPAVVPGSGLFSATERLTFPNHQRLSLEGLIGRAQSASYVPKSGDRGQRLVGRLRDLHAQHADSEEMVSLLYETEVFRARKL